MSKSTISVEVEYALDGLDAVSPDDYEREFVKRCEHPVTFVRVPSATATKYRVRGLPDSEDDEAIKYELQNISEDAFAMACG